MADEWEDAGFKPAGSEADPWAAAGFKEETGATEAPETVPTAFINRLRAGQQMQKVLEKAKEGFGEASPTGLSDQTMADLIRLGIFHDPAEGRPGPIQLANETMILPTAKAFDTLLRSVNAGLHGAGEMLGQIVDDLGASQGMGERARRETINLGNWAMIEAGFGRFSRPAIEPGGAAIDQAIGTLPKAQDFKTSAALVAGESGDVRVAEANLRQLWEEKGVHPAEAVQDAKGDAFFREQLRRPPPEPEPVEIVGETYKPGLKAQGIDAADAAKKEWAETSPIKTIDDLFANAKENQDALGQAGEQIASELGVTFRNPGVKGQARTQEKIDAGKAPGRVNDVVRGGFVVADPSQAETIVARLAQTFQVADEGWFVTPVGYFDRKVIVRFSDGQTGEIQIWHPDFLRAKKEGHRLYVEWRSLPKGDPRRAVLDQKMSELYEGVLSKIEPAWKALLGKGGAEGNLASKAALESTRPPTAISASSALDQAAEPSLTTQASTRPGDLANMKGSPSKEPNVSLGDISASPTDIRREGESDKQFTARVVDQRPEPKELPEEYARYFKTDENTAIVSIGKLDSSKTAAETADSGKNAARRMEASAKGEIAKREPIEVELKPDGRYLITDGNSTYVAAKQHGWEAIPVRISNVDERFAVGADVTRPENLPTLAEQPPPRPGRLIAAVQGAIDHFFDISRDIQMKVAPMAVAGTPEARAIAKDFANTMRRNRWEWARIVQEIETSPALRTVRRGRKGTGETGTGETAEQQFERMWNAADEESVLRQGGQTSEHMGLSTLYPAERAMVEDLHSRAQLAWLRARDRGLVEGEGLPAYTPRAVINLAGAGKGVTSLNSLGHNLRVTTSGLKHRKHMTAEETEAAAKALAPEAELVRDIRVLPMRTAELEDAIAGRGLIDAIKDYGKRTGTETVAEGGPPAGSDVKWFTIDHPAFRTWRPKGFETAADGTVTTIKDAKGNIIFQQVPIYVHADFEGPLRAVLTEKSGATYGALMSLKGKTMGLIMNSPMIHNLVEFGRAFPAMPIRIFKAYFDGNRAKNDVAIMTEAINNGLVPIGKRFFNQDITSIMEAPDLTPGSRSFTAKVLALVPGLFDEAAGTAVKRAIDKAGNFWHNTMLWDRIADLQMGIYVNMRADKIAMGVDPTTASRVAAHLANRYAGALPQEAMAQGATKFANFLLFSRTFTIGNLGVIKDALTGLPKDVIAQIERDMGTVDPKAVGYAKSMARRKAMMTLGLDIALAYIGYSLFQNMSNVLLGDSTLSEETHGYVKRLRDVIDEVKVHPMTLLQPFSIAERLSATNENEPSRKDRIRIGYASDGRAIYARNPVGKIGEEFVNYFSSPIEMLKKKEGTIARPMLQVLMNDKGFGRQIYDPTAETPAKYAQNIWNIVKHMIVAQTPEGQINALADLVRGEGDAKVNALQAFGPIAGFTFSRGAPGGPAEGELRHAQQQHKFAVDAELPELRKQIVRGDIAGATQRMTELGIAPGLQKFYIRTSLYPATRLSGRTLRDFYLYATPEQRQRLENAPHQ